MVKYKKRKNINALKWTKGENEPREVIVFRENTKGSLLIREIKK